jgi:hypothetical protein
VDHILDASGLKESKHDEFLPDVLAISKVTLNLFEMSLQKCMRHLLSQDLTSLSVMKGTVSKIVTHLFHKH